MVIGFLNQNSFRIIRKTNVTEYKAIKTESVQGKIKTIKKDIAQDAGINCLLKRMLYFATLEVLQQRKFCFIFIIFSNFLYSKIHSA